MRRSAALILVPTYVALWLLLLWFVLRRYDGPPDNEIAIVLGYGALVLSFPLGLAVLAVLGALAMAVHEFTGYSAPMGATYLVITWTIFMASGLFQWLVLLPALQRWWARRRTSNSTVETDARESGARGSP